MAETEWEYLVIRLWGYLGGPADLMNDRGRVGDADDITLGATGLLNARGAEGWELVSVARQEDPSAHDGYSYVGYMKRPVGERREH